MPCLKIPDKSNFPECQAFVVVSSWNNRNFWQWWQFTQWVTATPLQDVRHIKLTIIPVNVLHMDYETCIFISKSCGGNEFSLTAVGLCTMDHKWPWITMRCKFPALAASYMTRCTLDGRLFHNVQLPDHKLGLSLDGSVGFTLIWSVLVHLINVIVPINLNVITQTKAQNGL